jgi:hypothetical protein
MNRIRTLIAIGAVLLGGAACTPQQIAAVRSVTWESKCPAVTIADRSGIDFIAERDFLGRWETDGYVHGFSAQEDGTIYQTRWCATHMTD